MKKITQNIIGQVKKITDAETESRFQEIFHEKLSECWRSRDILCYISDFIRIIANWHHIKKCMNYIKPPYINDNAFRMEAALEEEEWSFTKNLFDY